MLDHNSLKLEAYEIFIKELSHYLELTKFKDNKVNREDIFLKIDKLKQELNDIDYY